MNPSLSAVVNVVRDQPVNLADSAISPVVFPQQVGSFVLQSPEKRLEHLESSTATYRHEKLGLTVQFIVNDEKERRFCIAFPTPAHDNSGLAHCVEHLKTRLIDGIENVCDPFNLITMGTMAGEVNAYTFQGITAFPFDAGRLSEFNRLTDLYIRSVFSRDFSPELVAEEVHRVVFNENQVYYRNPATHLSNAIYAALFPGQSAGFEHGGDPILTAQLTAADLNKFAETWYQPQLAHLLIQGEVEPERVLGNIERSLGKIAHLQRGNSVREIVEPVPLQEQFITQKYPWPDSSADLPNHYVGLAWLVQSARKPEQSLLYEALALAISGEGDFESPLDRCIQIKNRGDVASCSIDNLHAAPVFEINVKGCDREQAKLVGPEILNMLHSLAQSGITLEQELQAINSLIRSEHEAATQDSKGSYILGNVLEGFLQGQATDGLLDRVTSLEKLRGRIEQGESVLTPVLQELLNNKHMVSVIMEPSKDLYDARVASETAFMRERSKTSLAGIDSQSTTVRVFLEPGSVREELSHEPLTSLSTRPNLLATEEINLGVDRPRIVQRSYRGAKESSVDIVHSLAALPDALLPYASLLGNLWDIGTQKLAGQAGIDCDSDVVIRQDFSSGQISPVFLRRFMIPRECSSGLQQFIEQGGLKMAFPAEKLRPSLAATRAGMREDLLDIFAASSSVEERACSLVSPSSLLTDNVDGIRHYHFICRLLKEGNWPEVLQKLELVAEFINAQDPILYNVTAAPRMREGLLELVSGMANKQVVKQQQRHEKIIAPLDHSLADLIDSPLSSAYISQAWALDRMPQEIRGLARLTSWAVSSLVLWPNLRLAGGAYGATCNLDSWSNLLSFETRANPSVNWTLRVFDQACEALASTRVSNAELDRMKVGVIGFLSEAQSLSDMHDRGMREAIFRRPNSDHEAIHDQILGATSTQLRETAAWLKDNTKHSGLVIAGDSGILREARKDLRASKISEINMFDLRFSN